MLNNFEIDRPIPYYWPCIAPITNKKLINEGIDSLTTLIINLNLLGLPSYSRSIDPKKSMVSLREGYRLGYLGYSEYLNLNTSNIQFSDFESGIMNIKKELSQNKFCIVSGTTYFLPYSNDYKNKKYIHEYMQLFGRPVNHWLLVLSANDNEVIVYDPVPNNYLGMISTENFENFWKGDLFIPQLKNKPGIEKLNSYGYLSIEKKNNDPIAFNQIIVDCLYTIAFEYLSGSVIRNNDFVHYFGVASLEKFISDIENYNEREKNEYLLTVDKCISEMKYSRFFYRDFINEIVLRGNQEYKALLDKAQKICDNIFLISNVFKVNILRKRSVLDIYNDAIIKLIHQKNIERDFFDELLNMTQSSNLLIKKVDTGTDPIT